MSESIDNIASMPKEEILFLLLKKEYGYYFSILEITRQENEKLAARVPLSEINPLLKQKKILLSCIAEIEAAMLPLKKFWQEKRDRSDPISQKIREQLTALDHMLKEILQLDLDSQRNLEAHLQAIQKPQESRTSLSSKPKPI